MAHIVDCKLQMSKALLLVGSLIVLLAGSAYGAGTRIPSCFSESTPRSERGCTAQAVAPLPGPAMQQAAISVRTAAGQTIQVSPP